MAQAKALSLSKFTASVQAAVKAAVRKQPKFSIDPPKSIASAYLIRGIPVPDALLPKISLGEMQAFANDVAAQISGAHPEVFAAKGTAAKGAILSIGGHVIIGIPAVEAVNLTK